MLVRLPWPWGFIIGLASIVDGLLAIVTIGFFVGTLRQRASLEGARAAYNAKVKWDTIDRKRGSA